MDIQNKATNANNPIWVSVAEESVAEESVAEEFLDGTDSGGLLKNHEKFVNNGIDPSEMDGI